MDIEKMTLEQIEAHLEERKKVKPRATPESVIRILDYHGLDPYQEMYDDIRNLDWTPPKHDFEMELVDYLPCLQPLNGRYITAIYSSTFDSPDGAIPFDRNLVGKAVE